MTLGASIQTAARRGVVRLLKAAALLLVAGGSPSCAARSITAFEASVHRDSLATPVRVVRLQSSDGGAAVARPFTPSVVPPHDKVARPLRERIATGRDDIDTVLVTFRDPFVGDTAAIRRFGGGVIPAKPDSAWRNQVADSMQAARAPYYQAMIDTLALYNAVLLKPYRLTQAALVRIRLGAVDSLARHPSVWSVQALWGEPPPLDPRCSDPSHRTQVVGQWIRADAYRAAGYGQGQLSLLDSGVRSDHQGFNATGAQPLAHLMNCVEDTPCKEEDLQDDDYPGGHGTCSAAILAGKGAAGSNDDGLTEARIDSYKVYDSSKSDGVNADAAVAGLEAAMERGHSLIVAEIATSCGLYDATTGLANTAYDVYGCAVIAANGNVVAPDPSGNVPASCCPGNAARALGVGAACTIDSVFHADYASGRMVDERIKPEISSFTGATTAGIGAVSDWSRSYTGTSGSTPFAAGAALLMWNRMAQGNTPVVPGQVYAMMIAGGHHGRVDEKEGAGRVRLPIDGRIYWGSVVVREGKTKKVNIKPTGIAVKGVEAAIWWPELDKSWNGFPDPGTRAYITLTAKGHGGSQTSDVPGSVFQRVSLEAPSSGTNRKWKLEIAVKNAPPDPSAPGSPRRREIFYAAWARP